MGKFAFDPPKLSAGYHHDNGTVVNHMYQISQGEQDVGHLWAAQDKKDPRKLHIEQVEVDGGPNSVGPRTVRHVIKQLKERHPEVEEISGNRTSGSRVLSKKPDPVARIKAR